MYARVLYIEREFFHLQLCLWWSQLTCNWRFVRWLLSGTQSILLDHFEPSTIPVCLSRFPISSWFYLLRSHHWSLFEHQYLWDGRISAAIGIIPCRRLLPLFWLCSLPLCTVCSVYHFSFGFLFGLRSSLWRSTFWVSFVDQLVL